VTRARSRRWIVFVVGVGAALVGCASTRDAAASDPIRLTLYPDHARAHVDEPTPIFLVVRNVSDRAVVIVDPSLEGVAAFSIPIESVDGSAGYISTIELGRPSSWEEVAGIAGFNAETKETPLRLHWDGPLVELPPGAEFATHLGDYEIEVTQDWPSVTPWYSRFHREGTYRLRARYHADRESARGALAAAKTPAAHPERLTPLDVTSNEIDVVIYAK
jgi:hypothetical protein